MHNLNVPLLCEAGPVVIRARAVNRDLVCRSKLDSEELRAALRNVLYPSVCVCAYVCEYVCMYICVYIYMCVCVCVCVYIYAQ